MTSLIRNSNVKTPTKTHHKEERADRSKSREKDHKASPSSSSR